MAQNETTYGTRNFATLSPAAQAAIRLGWNENRLGVWNADYDKWPDFRQIQYETGRAAYSETVFEFGAAPIWREANDRFILSNLLQIDFFINRREARSSVLAKIVELRNAQNNSAPRPEVY